MGMIMINYKNCGMYESVDEWDSRYNIGES